MTTALHDPERLSDAELRLTAALSELRDRRAEIAFLKSEIDSIVESNAVLLETQDARFTALKTALDQAIRDRDAHAERARELAVRVTELEQLINTPRTDEFFDAVRGEAAHQIERWGTAHDEGKTDHDWFWLIGYLAGKALRGDAKRLHHIITTAAVCLNWWRQATGVCTSMRPGIAAPPGDRP